MDTPQSHAALPVEALAPSDEQIEKPIAWWSGNEYGGADEHGKISIGTFVEHEDTWHDIPVYAGWNNEGKPSRTAPPAVLVEPAGFKLVPVQPTDAMLSAMAECDGYQPGDRDRPSLTRWEDYWHMALAAAPSGVTKQPAPDSYLKGSGE